MTIIVGAAVVSQERAQLADRSLCR
jgi:hypothetical protein